ncbi:MAG: coenzyme F420 hydrogenase [Actinomycetia bacterium]|nr:coenzyme F420 hydrogenase [Actinomycetes bacterium]
MVTTPAGSLRPVAQHDLAAATVDTIYDVCPGTRVDGLPESLLDPETSIDPIWGPWIRMVRAWSADPVARFEGSTGGVLTALGQYLLRTEQVSFVLHTKASSAEPTFGQATLSFTEDEVLSAAGSRYGPTATLIDLDSVLDRGEPFAFIGKPCDIGALRNLGRHDERVDALVRYWLTPVCGGYGPTDFTDRFLAGIGIAREDLTGFRYRGRGCPGPTTAETVDRVVERHYLDYWGDDESQWSLPWRCRLCPDGIGESADIAAADTWIGGSPHRDDTGDDPGTNAVIARTRAGADLLAAAVADGALTIEREIGPHELSTYQPHQVKKKERVGSRFEGLAAEGRIVPKTTRLRLHELGARLSVEERAKEQAGTRDRVTRGVVSEPRSGD